MQWLSWSDASVAAVAAAATTRVLDPRGPARRLVGRGRAARTAPVVSAWTRELSVMFALYALWQLAGTLSLAQVSGAVARGRDIERFERHLPLPSESWVQQLVLADRWVLRIFNIYYVGLHVLITGACLVWVFSRHRSRYPVVRNALALTTGASLLVALVPVAPPRLVPGAGLVDTGRLVGPTVYPATARPGLDQLSAMPSVHVAWAIVVAGAFVYVLRSRWRWLSVAYPLATLFVVIVTGNHYWADGFVAAFICLSAWAAAIGWDRVAHRREALREPPAARLDGDRVPSAR